ncbi:Ribosome biogenesis protein SLX9 domain containing protein [Hyaloscypha variabilis]
MAPTAPKKRPSMRSKTSSKSGSGLISRPLPPTPSNPAASTSTSTQSFSSPSFTNSKKDRRTIKHSALLSRIEKTSKKPLKRRRPSKKLVTTLESLADALPDVAELVESGKGGKMGGRGKSLRSKPGALKRKEKLERGERERFGKNLAVILGGKVGGGESMDVEGQGGEGGEKKREEVVKGRFAALRAWVGTNMEKHPAFEKGTE